MKKNINVIQIKGIRGLCLAAFIVICLIAGFAVFPGFVCTKIWNICSTYLIALPKIGLIQGVLLWGIIAASYFIFRKESLIVCMKTPDGLNEEELKAVLADIKKSYQYDSIVQSMHKAREAELKIKDLSENIPKHDVDTNLKINK